MENQLRTNLLKTAAAFAAANDCALSTVGHRAKNDARFFARLGDPSKTFTVRTFDEIMCWFVDYWPAGHQMPLELMKWIADTGYQSEGRVA